MCFYPARIKNISSDIHLWCQVSQPLQDDGSEDDSEEFEVRNTTKKVPYHKLPHTYLGLVSGFEDCCIYVFFPYLYKEGRESNFLSEDQLGRFFGLLLKSIFEVGFYNAAHLQHFPSSFNHAKVSAQAQAHEKGSRAEEKLPRLQSLHYFLPVKGLKAMWSLLTQQLNRAGYYDLADPILLISSKNLKTIFRGDSPSDLMENFFSRWNYTFDVNEFHGKSIWIDIGKEVVNPKISYQKEGEVGEAGWVYLWKKCCLERIAEEFKMEVPKSGMNINFYPWALTRDICNMTIEPGRRHPLRYAGLIYSQFYSSSKEIFDAGKVYPFDDTALEGLAVDQSLRKV